MIWTVLAASALASATPATPPVPSTTCPPAAAFPIDIRVTQVVRVRTGANGESMFEAATLEASGHDYFHPGQTFFSIDFGAASKVQLVQSPPNVTFPWHPSPGYEAFLTIAGSSFVLLRDGSERELTPGTLVIMEDMESTTGHGGRTGPCGSVTIQIVATTPIL